MGQGDLVQTFAAAFWMRTDGALRITVHIDGYSFRFSPHQAELLEQLIHEETQKAVEQVALEVDRFA